MIASGAIMLAVILAVLVLAGPVYGIRAVGRILWRRMGGDRHPYRL